MLPVARILLNGSQKPTDALLIIVVLLALKNNLTDLLAYVTWVNT